MAGLGNGFRPRGSTPSHGTGRTAEQPKTAEEGRVTALAPYIFHGVVFDEMRAHDTQARADCPLCGKERKFLVGTVDKFDGKHFAGGWECKSCLANGNQYTFWSKYWEACAAGTRQDDYDKLAAQRGLLYPETLRRWGCVKSILTEEWIVPGYNAKGNLNNLYRYGRVPGPGGGRTVLLSMPGINPGMFNMHNALRSAALKELDVCEGPWDGMALEEVMMRAKHGTNGELVVTTNTAMSLLGGRAVVAVPGAGTFHPDWSSVCAGKRINLLFDNDHPRLHPKTQQEIEGSALAGIKRVVGVLAAAAEQPEAVHYLAWGGDEAQHNKDLPTGFDVRDLMRAGGMELRQRFECVASLRDSVRPVPTDWVAAGGHKSGADGKVRLAPIPCQSWEEVDEAFKHAMKWTPGLKWGLANMLACVCSTELVGDPIYMIVMSPPSTGKTQLAESISTARKHVIPKDSFSGLFSGYQTDKEGSENQSLVLKMVNKTLVIKDADTILQHPNKAQILSQVRALFDRAVRTSHKNMMSLDLDNIHTTVILCGTSSLRTLDESELGQRFLTYRIMDSIDPLMEAQINERALGRLLHQLTTHPKVNGHGADSPEMARAKQLCGGYVMHLCENVEENMIGLHYGEVEQRALEECGRFVAYFRARASTKQAEEVHRELSTRLVMQFGKLACCLAVVLQKRGIDAEVIEQARKVALDSAQGRTLRLAKYLYTDPWDGHDKASVAKWMRCDEAEGLKMLRFLSAIQAVENFEVKLAHGRKAWRWRLTAPVQALYGAMMDPDGAVMAPYLKAREQAEARQAAEARDYDTE